MSEFNPNDFVPYQPIDARRTFRPKFGQFTPGIVGGYEEGEGPPICTDPGRSGVLPSDAEARKQYPMCDGLLDYFPLALAEVSRVSFVGNEQHNPGESLHWAREKSTDHGNKIIRHLIDRGGVDSDGTLHSAKLAWRALALLQTELEEAGATPGRASRFPDKENAA